MAWAGAGSTSMDWEPGRTEAGRLEDSRLDAEELRLEAALRAGRHLEILAEAQAAGRRGAAAGAAVGAARAGAVPGRAAERVVGEPSSRSGRCSTWSWAWIPVRTWSRWSGRSCGTNRHCRRPTRRRTTSATCPYRGLIAYDVQDAETFFGRAAETAECLRRLAVSGVLAVVGASG